MCPQDEPSASAALYQEGDVVSSFYEVLDEYLVAENAEAETGSVPQYGSDEETPLDELARTIAAESTVYRELRSPALVSVLLGDDIAAADTDGTYIDRHGRGHVVIYGSTPWDALHQLAHLLTQGQSARRWLDTYRDLVRERYGEWDAALFDYDTVRRIAYDEHIQG